MKYIIFIFFFVSYLNGAAWGPLHNACYDNYMNRVIGLINMGHNINEKTHDNCTPVYIACFAGNKKILKYLLKKGADINATSLTNLTPLHIAVGKGHFGIVKTLVKNGAKLNEIDKDANTPLYFACENNRPDIIKYLIENGADVNVGYSPLHRLCLMNKLDLVKELVNAGADIFAPQKFHTPIEYACKGGNLDIIKFLIEKGEKINDYMIFSACQLGYLDIIKFLTADPKNLNFQDICGNSLLHIAAMYGHERIVQYLIESGADMYVLNNSNQSIVYVACKNKQPNVMRYLFKVRPELIDNPIALDYLKTLADFAYLRSKGKEDAYTKDTLAEK